MARGAALQRKPIEPRFWSKVNFDGPVPERAELGNCWIWRRATTGDGYGQFWVYERNQMVKAHRVAFALLSGYWPPDVADHLCRTRACVRPSHLEAVTKGINTLRGISFSAENARKTACPRGHALAGDNLVIYGRARCCRHCKRDAGRAAQQRARDRRIARC